MPWVPGVEPNTWSAKVSDGLVGVVPGLGVQVDQGGPAEEALRRTHGPAAQGRGRDRHHVDVRVELAGRVAGVGPDGRDGPGEVGVARDHDVDVERLQRALDKGTTALDRAVMSALSVSPSRSKS